MQPGKQRISGTCRSALWRGFYWPASSLALVGIGSLQPCLAPVLSGSRRSTRSERQKARRVSRRLQLEALEEYCYPGDPIGLLVGPLGGVSAVVAAQSLGLFSGPADHDRGDFSPADFSRQDQGADNRSVGLSWLDDGSSLPDEGAGDILGDTWSGGESRGGSWGEPSDQPGSLMTWQGEDDPATAYLGANPATPPSQSDWNKMGQDRSTQSSGPTLLNGGGAGGWGGSNVATAEPAGTAASDENDAGQPAAAATGSGGSWGFSFVATGSSQSSAGGATASGFPNVPTPAVSLGGSASTAQSVSPPAVDSAASTATPNSNLALPVSVPVSPGPSAATETGSVAGGSTTPVGAPALQSAVSQLPLTFEVNQGQTDPQVQFLSRGSGYNLFLSSDAATFALSEPQQTASTTASASSPASGLQPGTNDPILADTTTAVLQMQFVGANPAAQAVGVNQQPGTVNYLIGNDPSQWHTDIATYSQVDYQNLYPGINLVYYGNLGRLRHNG